MLETIIFNALAIQGRIEQTTAMLNLKSSTSQSSHAVRM